LYLDKNEKQIPVLKNNRLIQPTNGRNVYFVNTDQYHCKHNQVID
jgi:hypothetical protein